MYVQTFIGISWQTAVVRIRYRASARVTQSFLLLQRNGILLRRRELFVEVGLDRHALARVVRLLCVHLLHCLHVLPTLLSMTEDRLLAFQRNAQLVVFLQQVVP